MPLLKDGLKNSILRHPRERDSAKRGSQGDGMRSPTALRAAEDDDKDGARTLKQLLKRFTYLAALCLLLLAWQAHAAPDTGLQLAEQIV